MLTPVAHRYSGENIIMVNLAVLNENIKILILIKDPGIEKLVFRFLFAASSVFIHQIIIRKSIDRVFVYHFHIAMRRGIIEVIKNFLDIFSMVSLRIA